MSGREDAVQFACNELAWHGALQLALKLHQPSIEGLTDDLLRDPHKFAEIGPGVAHLANHARFKPNTDAGGYRNKTAMVYIVSVLETFLKEVCKECLSPPLAVGDAMFGELLACIGRSGRISQFDQADETKQVNLIRLIRNAIVHNRGKVPRDFWGNGAKPHDDATNYIQSWPLDYQAEFRKYYQPGNEVWLHIDKVVMPSVFCGIGFVQYMDRQMGLLAIM